jgi:micrococcal nuclease
MTARRRKPYRASRAVPLRRAAVFLVALAIIAVVRWWQGLHQPPPPPETMEEGTYTVQRAVDGDTLLLSNGVRIRLIGVNTPETVKPHSPVEPFGPEAKQFTEGWIAEAKGQVRLQFDRERLDKYGRHLAYVWADSRMLNEELIRAGLGRAELQYRYSSTMKTRFRRAEEEAQSAGRGIWSRQAARRAA